MCHHRDADWFEERTAELAEEEPEPVDEPSDDAVEDAPEDDDVVHVPPADD